MSSLKVSYTSWAKGLFRHRNRPCAEFRALADKFADPDNTPARDTLAVIWR
uniref:hypothetical protein n=1 Tax=Neisseria gonorrhoeae TaxID=485 RepID=UPI0038799034